ncbi:sugar ABC transporter substrate-binding protein [Psychromicrobium xiongbiense]|uniref:sugar ABC transporter substrate-binding protein n=1 Tax=Psychromicrobium xiongbiense TaxID=3051184 RepID=UPI002557858B|nr:sugar ABC transporter substrate-binding protein [Psychromicrobium sp. YIM S02556]
MPRHLGVLASLTGVLLLATACGSSTPTSNVPQDDNATLEVWTRTTPGGSGEQGLKKLAAAFEAKTGKKVNVTAIFDDFETKLAQSAAQKHLPDLVLNDSSQLGTMVTQGIVREVKLDTLSNGKDLLAPALQAAKATDGKYYGVPYSAQSSALLIRKDWRTRLGLPVPTTRDDLLALAKAFATQDPDGNGKADTAGLAVPGSTKRGYASWYFSNFLWADGGDFVTAKDGGKFSPSMSTPEAVASAQWFTDLQCKSKVMQPGAASMDTPPTNETFESGKAGMYVVGPYLLPRFDKTLGADKYEVVPMPKGAKDASVLAEGGSVYLMAGSRNEKGQDAFADYVISPEGQKVGMEGDGAFIIQLPVNKNVNVSDVRKDPRWDVYAKTYADAGHYAPSLPNWTAIRQSSADTLNALIADCSLNVGSELKKLDGKIAESLAQQGIGAS